MNFKRIGRILVCLVLVCALLINISPIKAEASVAAVAAWLYVNKEVIAACALAALGIMVGTNPEAFQTVARDCANFLETSTSWVYNGTIAVLGLGSASMSTAYLPGGLLQTIWEWIFNTGVVTSSGSYASYYTTRSCSSYSEALAYASHCPAAYIGYSSDGATKYIIVTSDSETYVSLNDGTLIIQGYGTNHSIYDGGTRFLTRSSNTNYYYYNCTKLATSPILLAAYDLTLGLIEYAFDGTSPKKLEETETYKEYSSTIIEFPPPDYSDFSPDVDNIPYFPIGVPSTTIEGVTWQDQQEAQSGNHELDFDFDTSTDPGTGADPDPGGGSDATEPEDPDSGGGEGTDYTSWFERLIKGIEELPSKFAAWFSALVTFAQQFPDLFREWMAAVPGLFETWIADIRTFSQEFPSLFEEWVNNIIRAIQEYPAQMEQWLNALPDKFAGFFENVQLGFASVADAIVDLGNFILSGLRTVLTEVLNFLFVPEEGFVEEKVQSLSDEFSFAASIITTGKALTNGLSGITTSPPIIYIDLGASTGSHNWGGKTVFMDLSWYAEYKPTVDILISAFLWICFIWRLILKLPGIISGMPGDFAMGAAHLFGLDNHLPTRNAAYEVQRAENRNYIKRGPPK